MSPRLPKVVFTAPVSEMPNDLLDGRVRVKVIRHKLPLTEEHLIAKLKGASGVLCFLSDPLTGRALESCPKLKAVALHAVGYNNVDIAAASRLGITVTYTPGVLTEATADLAWTLILGACRRMVEGDKMVRAGRFKGWDAGLLLGMDLSGKTLGIVGLGRIGQAVARRAIPFGLHVAYTQRKRADATAEAALGARYLPLDQLIRESDILSLHCPLTPETDHLFSRERICAMKPGAVLINASRGPLVDEAALAEALETGHLLAAGLDVFEREPEVCPALRRLSNVVLMPHAGSAGRETRAAMARMAVSDLMAVLDGRTPQHQVPRGEG